MFDERSPPVKITLFTFYFFTKYCSHLFLRSYTYLLLLYIPPPLFSSLPLSLSASHSLHFALFQLTVSSLSPLSLSLFSLPLIRPIVWRSNRWHCSRCPDCPCPGPGGCVHREEALAAVASEVPLTWKSLF